MYDRIFCFVSKNLVVDLNVGLAVVQGGFCVMQSRRKSLILLVGQDPAADNKSTQPCPETLIKSGDQSIMIGLYAPSLLRLAHSSSSHSLRTDRKLRLLTVAVGICNKVTRAPVSHDAAHDGISSFDVKRDDAT